MIKIRIKKSFILGILVGSAFVGTCLAKKSNRLKVKERFQGIFDRMKKRRSMPKAEYMEQIGDPGQVEFADEVLMENAKMVSEGSQYGVHYYQQMTNKSEKDL